MFTSAPEAFLPAHYSCFLLSAKWIPIKSTVLQLEFGRIYLVQCSKSHCLTSFSHVAPFLESVTEKMRLVISCNRILLGFFVLFFFCPPPPPYVKSAFSQIFMGLHTLLRLVRLRPVVNYGIKKIRNLLEKCSSRGIHSLQSEKLQFICS